MGYNNLKVFPLQSSSLVPLYQTIGFNISMNSSTCPCSGLDLSTDCNPLGVYLCSKQSLICEPQYFQERTCCSMDLYPQSVTLRCTYSSMSLPTVPSEVNLLQTWPNPWLQFLQGCTCSVMGLSTAPDFEVLQHDLTHCHRYFKAYLLQHGLILGPHSFHRGIAAAAAQT